MLPPKLFSVSSGIPALWSAPTPHPHPPHLSFSPSYLNGNLAVPEGTPHPPKLTLGTSGYSHNLWVFGIREIGSLFFLLSRHLHMCTLQSPFSLSTSVPGCITPPFPHFCHSTAFWLLSLIRWGLSSQFIATSPNRLCREPLGDFSIHPAQYLNQPYSWHTTPTVQE